MLQRLPEFIDPLRFAETGRMLEGTLPLRGMQRIGELLHDREGEVQVELAFGRDAVGVACMTGHLTARLVMTCQRCMHPVNVDISSEIMLGLVRTEHEAERLPEGYEPLIVASEEVRLSDIVEDELLLQLPLIPMHPAGTCSAGDYSVESGAAETERRSPFSVLTALKRNNGGNKQE